MEALEAKLAAATDEDERNKRTVEVQLLILNWWFLNSTCAFLQPDNGAREANAVCLITTMQLTPSAMTSCSSAAQSREFVRCVQSLHEAVATAEARSRELYEVNARLEAHVQARLLMLCALHDSPSTPV
jgi:hypothetical protein